MNIVKIAKNKQTLGTSQAPKTQWIHEHQDRNEHQEGDKD
jgi:hypothetical protein